MKRICIGAVIGAGGVILAAGLGQTEVAAQDAAPAGECIEREQAERLVATLRTRTNQLRDAASRLQRADDIVNQANARAETAARQAAATQEVLALAAERNRELVEIGMKILEDYENLSLGKKVAAREPLTGLYRVQLENKLQAFEDELAAAQFFPEKALEEALEEDEDASARDNETPTEDAPATGGAE